MYPRNLAASFGVVFRKTADGQAETAGAPAAFRMIETALSGGYGASAAATGTFTHKGNGQWQFAASAADMDGVRVHFLFTLTACHPVEVEIFTAEVLADTFVIGGELVDPGPYDLAGDATPSLSAILWAAGLGGVGKTVDAPDGASYTLKGYDDATTVRTVAIDTAGATAERGRIAAATDAAVASGVKGTVGAGATTTAIPVTGLPASTANFANQYVEFLDGPLEGAAKPIAGYSATSGTAGTITLAAGDALSAAPAAGVGVRILGHHPTATP